MHGLSVMSLARWSRSNVDHRLASNRRGGESGAVATLVAIFFGTGVLLGLGALVIDTGSLLYERRQLQSGADAAALAIAKTCMDGDKAGVLCGAPDILTLPLDPAYPSSTLRGLAGANAADSISDIASICGSAALVAANPTAFPTVCLAPATPGLVECPYTTSTAKYVEVRTSTRTVSDQTFLPPILAQTLAGGTYSGETVKACARVGWGPGKPTGLPVLPIAMSYCEWKAATGANPPTVPGTFVTPLPNYSYGVKYGYDKLAGTPTPSWPTATEHEVYTAKTLAAPGCTTWNGHAAPGNFGALKQDPAGSCKVPDAAWMPGDPGNDGACPDAKLVPYLGQQVLIPLFDCVAASTDPITNLTDCKDGGQANYHITGYATFYLTGWQFDGGGYDRSIADNHKLCDVPSGNSGRCLSGWFMRGAIGVGELVDAGPPDFGTSVIQVLG